MQSNTYKARYHPMMIMMYHSNMFTPEQLRLFPRSTLNHWNKFKHKNYDGFELAEPYINDFNVIKEVLVSNHLKSAVKFMCVLSNGYKGVIADIESNKKLLRKHSKNITYSIARIAKYGNINITDACKIFGVSKNWFYIHRKKSACQKSIIGKCFKEHPNQLPFEDVNQIEQVVANPENYGKTKTTLYYLGMRANLFTCALSTFFKYSALLGYQKLDKKPKEKRLIGFRATRVFEWLHVDVTLVQTKNDGIQRVAFVKDNYSKALLHYKSTNGSADSKFIRKLFEETFAKYKLSDTNDSINILSDGGSENKGSLLEWIDGMIAPPVVRKITAKSDDFHFSNSMAESTHSIYKTEFLRRKHSFDRIQHIKDLDRFMVYHNDARFPSEHYGLTPNEVLDGQHPFKHRFKEQIQQAKIDRITQNRAFNLCPTLCLP